VGCGTALPLPTCVKVNWKSLHDPLRWEGPRVRDVDDMENKFKRRGDKGVEGIKERKREEWRYLHSVEFQSTFILVCFHINFSSLWHRVRLEGHPCVSEEPNAAVYKVCVGSDYGFIKIVTYTCIFTYYTALQPRKYYALVICNLQ
jgi:hypothetical protein